MKKAPPPRPSNIERLIITTPQRRLVFFLSFLIPLVLYIMALAPTVTFEDSGELITAAHTLGIPHEPGYPLFTIIGKVFSLLPFGDVAYRINLMSAVFSALGVAMISMIIMDLALFLFGRVTSGWNHLLSVVAVCAPVVVGVGRSYFSQAVITEVYALNNFFTGLLLWLLVRWYATFADPFGDENETRRERYFYLYSFFAGLTLTNHHTSAVFIILGLIFAFIVDRRFLLDGRRLMAGGTCLLVGLLPYLFLPLASMRDPAMDWGDPENWTNFWRVVGRHQYGLDVGTTRSLKVLFSQIGLHYEMLFEQFTIAFILIGLIGLAALWIRHRKLFAMALVFNVLTGPLVAYITNVNITGRDPFAVAEQRGLVSVMYLPFYVLWGVLIGMGLLVLLERAVQKKASRGTLYGLAVAVLVGTVWMSWRGYTNENMNRYYFTRQFCENLEKQIEPNSVVLANWDPFAFPVMYYQHVEGRAKDMVFIDIELLRRSWYVKMLRSWYPAFMAECQNEVDGFLEAVRPFENKEPFDPNFIQQRYIAMIRAFIDRHYDKRPVYMTIFQPIRPLEQGVLGNYALESRLVAQQLRRPPLEARPVDKKNLDLADLTNPDVPRDRMANMLRNYYALRFAERAALMEGRDRSEALRLYERSMEMAEAPLIRANIQQRYDLLKKNASVAP